jgi:hypothetical protein
MGDEVGFDPSGLMQDLGEAAQELVVRDRFGAGAGVP